MYAKQHYDVVLETHCSKFSVIFCLVLDEVSYILRKVQNRTEMMFEGTTNTLAEEYWPAKNSLQTQSTLVTITMHTRIEGQTFYCDFSLGIIISYFNKTKSREIFLADFCTTGMGLFSISHSLWAKHIHFTVLYFPAPFAPTQEIISRSEMQHVNAALLIQMIIKGILLSIHSKLGTKAII